MADVLTTIAVALRILLNPAANAAQKRLTGNGLHPLLVNFLTYFLLGIGCVGISTLVVWPVLPLAFWLYAVLAGVVGAVGNGFLVKALQGGDLSVLGPINAYKAVVSLVVGVLLLGEVPSGWGLAGITLVVWGSYVVLDTTEDRFTWALLRRKAIRFRIWAMVLTAIEAVLLKKIILLSSTTIAFISWCVLGALFSLLLLPLSKLRVSPLLQSVQKRHLPPLAFLVLCIGVVQYTTNYVFDRMPVGYALSLFQLSIIVSIWLGYRMFNEGAIRKKLVGSVIMIIGSVMIILLK